MSDLEIILLKNEYKRTPQDTEIQLKRDLVDIDISTLNVTRIKVRLFARHALSAVRKSIDHFLCLFAIACLLFLQISFLLIPLAFTIFSDSTDIFGITNIID